MLHWHVMYKSVFLVLYNLDLYYVVYYCMHLLKCWEDMDKNLPKNNNNQCCNRERQLPIILKNTENETFEFSVLSVLSAERGNQSTGANNCYQCCCHEKHNNRTRRASDSMIECHKNFALKKNTRLRPFVKATKSNSYYRSSSCQLCGSSNLFYNKNNSSSKDQVQSVELLQRPPEYTPGDQQVSVDVINNNTSSNDFRINKLAVCVVVVLIAIIACLVVALTFFRKYNIQ